MIHHVNRQSSLHSRASGTCSAVATLLTTLVAVGGCGNAQSPPATSPTSATVPLAIVLPLAPASPGATHSTIYISDRLRKECGFTVSDTVREPPRFAFARSAILPEDGTVLSQVAQCLTGPLLGRSVRLIGRADPRGTAEYNMALGERRANAVMTYLDGLGVARSQLSETSRGALDASGGSEAAWRQDRRVDIDLLEGPPEPGGQGAGR